mgnify:CR=1 FL=1
MGSYPTRDNDIADEYGGETSNWILFLQFWTPDGSYPVRVWLPQVKKYLKNKKYPGFFGFFRYFFRYSS